jgi:phenylalanyl-tRNA synthetase beta chain
MAGLGFHELMTYSLVSADTLQRRQPWCDAEPVKVRNPVTVDRAYLRVTNMANALSVKRFNETRGTARVDLFELGTVNQPRPGEKLPEERTMLTVLTDRDDGLRVLKGVICQVLAALGIDDDLAETPGAAGPFDEGMSVTLELNGDMLGVAGLVAQDVADALDLQSRPALAEIDFDRLTGLCTLHRTYTEVPAFPGTSRDLAVVVAEDVLWEDIEACVRRAAPPMLRAVEFVDLYRGRQVPRGHKSIAFTMTFRRADGTITAEEAEQAQQAILDALKHELNAALR